MVLAASTAARYAVTSLGVAALAVSATLIMRDTSPRPNTVVIEDDATALQASVREVLLVGSPDDSSMQHHFTMQQSALAGCAAAPTRVTVYAHFSGGIITHITSFSDDYDAALCVNAALGKLTVEVLDEMDVKVPIDFVANRWAQNW